MSNWFRDKQRDEDPTDDSHETAAGLLAPSVVFGSFYIEATSPIEGPQACDPHDVSLGPVAGSKKWATGLAKNMFMTSRGVS
jgi:hypothetical protein